MPHSIDLIYVYYIISNIRILIKVFNLLRLLHYNLVLKWVKHILIKRGRRINFRNKLIHRIVNLINIIKIQ